MSDGGESPTNQPPPAYEVSQHEFDNKISRAVEESLSTAVSNVRVVDDDGWPVYDPSAFEAVAASYEREGAASSSTASEAERSSSRAGSHDDKKMPPLQLPMVKPLRIRNRAPSAGTQASEAERLESRSRSPAARYRHASSPLPPNHHSSSPTLSDLEAPPPFTPVARHPNGVPFDGLTRLQYIPGDSRPSSPFYSPEPRHSLPPLSPPSPQPSTLTYQSPPPPHRRPVQRRIRQSNEYLKDVNGPRTSRLDFDPRTAYGRDSHEAPHTQTPAQNFSAADLYPHAVASHLKPISTPSSRPQTEFHPSSPPAPSMFRSSRDAASTYSSFQRPESYVGNQEIMTVIRPGSTHHSQSPPIPNQPQSQLQSPSFNRPAFPREHSVPAAHSPPSAQWGRYAPSEAELIKELYRSRG
ncbi:uncharacterized protein STEHIDRAFT_146425 [Stereum hirsutum FP-91666 SS1]|uniref:uncharacterized protein n=1 Tax=Stereum hirsutum (strain FP-91666) TaxID=721885 RepID=UPI000440B055|nr:uncharacterized protein STEHIDRAFT_146425 [Stereum hirsutum FP-91666 SS1]EIM88424.1 hypothetical protein STEHIDRAFT_146425 [Stereum hirsutum FP-91666 SS1]